MVIESSEDLEVVKSFDDLGIREELLRGKNIAQLFSEFNHLNYRYLRLRIQQAICSLIKSNFANYQR